MKLTKDHKIRICLIGLKGEEREEAKDWLLRYPHQIPVQFQISLAYLRRGKDVINT